MDYVNLGNTGLKVSRLCLGCMSFGDAAAGGSFWAWVLDERDSREYFRRALQAGINFFDTANIYTAGTSEEFTGRALRDLACRDEVVVATKAYGAWRNAPNTGGLSRKALFAAVDASLTRLGMDYIDLFQIHRFDVNTPVEETMEALHDIVKAGKARYLGASSMMAWQFAQMQHVADSHGWTRFVSMQPQVNLLYREEEREMLPLCRASGVAVIPWSPLAGGRLVRPAGTETARTQANRYSSFAKEYEASDRGIIDAVASIAQSRGVSNAEVALAWVLHKPGITAPIVGATKPAHLEAAIAASELQLDSAEIAALEAHYMPRPVSGVNFPLSDDYKLTVCDSEPPAR
ncbi:aldo/keto reductase [Mangrovimicrobium sediminis]|uniref:Aldo/keto reductase n=1 Tax=Mangrovimicrobium sediminis TaxID=2562682 RepID=A0A4Z0M290_9GAMM|nr:aldo/keto reductase [Haliea sp. SAOS-164]TGD73547.1 aldo/keto reductase [Haliea sp. SAOS-164]